jgi:hypothetical protein
MRPQLSKLLRALVTGVSLTSLAATAQDVVVVSPVDPVTVPVLQPQKKPTFTSLIAAESLAQQGVTDPSGTELGAAEASVQAMRDSGMGWGAIANSMNVRLGDVVSAANKSPRAIKTRTDADTDTTADRAKRTPPGDKRLAAAGDTTTTRGLSAGKSGNQGGASNGGSSGGGKGGGAGNGGSGGGGKGGGAGNGGSGGGGKGGGAGNSGSGGGGKGGGAGNSGSGGGGKGGGNGGGKR